jgi:hypothetical protein
MLIWSPHILAAMACPSGLIGSRIYPKPITDHTGPYLMKVIVFHSIRLGLLDP